MELQSFGKVSPHEWDRVLLEVRTSRVKAVRCETDWCVGGCTTRVQGLPLSIISYASGSIEEPESREAELPDLEVHCWGVPDEWATWTKWLEWNEGRG